jgi:glycosyltransferase involved in cell wall biosynthesis
MPDFLVFVGVFHKLLGRPVILDLHDLTVELLESRLNGRKSLVLSRLARTCERISCGFADHLITTSYAFRDQLVARGVKPERITLVLNSADERVFKAKQRREWGRIERGARLLYHGTVSRRFGLHIAIEAVAKLQVPIPETTLRIHGRYDSKYRRELEDLVKSLGLQGRVILDGFVTQEEIAGIIEESDIGIVPYIDDCFMNLAFSTKIFEYAIMKLPIVASRLASFVSIFSLDEISYCQPENPVDLKDKIVELCKSPGVRKENSERSARICEDMSWALMSERYLKLVKGLIRRKTG